VLAPAQQGSSGLSVGRAAADAYGYYLGTAVTQLATANPILAVAGGAVGASIVDSFFGREVSLNKMKMNPEKALVNRSAMKVTGETKVKKAPPKLKITAEFRESVKDVLRSASASGVYKVIKAGYIGSLVKDVAGVFAGDDMGSTHSAIAYSSPTEPSGSRTLFNALVTFQVGGNSVLRPNTGLNFFTPAKIIDAASVLFNNKTPGNPYSSTTNNLATNFQPSTGLPIPTNPGSLKVFVKDSFAQFTIKNVSFRVVSLDIWECTPTLKFQNVPALSALTAMYSAQSETASQDTNIAYYNGVAGSAGLQSTMFFERNLDPLYCASKIGFPFKWKKRTMILAPQETCIHKIQGPKGEFDFAKITSLDTAVPANTVYNFNTIMKGWSVSCIMSINGDQVLQSSGQSLGGRDTYYSGGNTVLGNL